MRTGARDFLFNTHANRSRLQNYRATGRILLSLAISGHSGACAAGAQNPELQMSGDLAVGVARGCQFEGDRAADIHDLGAAAGEAASGRNVDRQGYFALDRR